VNKELIAIEFTLNGESQKIEVRSNHTLLQVLRNQLGLTGTKVGCEEGECGACTVILNGKAVNSCIILAPEVNGCEIITIEGLSKEGQLDVVQEAYIEKGAVQCGYCTSGMILSSKALLMENEDPTEEEIREALAGNLCRCGGYHNIIKAVSRAAKKMKET